MTKNPIINAFSASAYIVLISMVMNIISQTQGSKPDSAFAPVVLLSMLTFSVAMMGYLFFYQPLVLLVDGKKKEAVKLFLHTIGVFGAITVVASLLIFSGLV